MPGSPLDPNHFSPDPRFLPDSGDGAGRVPARVMWTHSSLEPNFESLVIVPPEPSYPSPVTISTVHTHFWDTESEIALPPELEQVRSEGILRHFSLFQLREMWARGSVMLVNDGAGMSAAAAFPGFASPRTLGIYATSPS
jgi:hypothetical protein